MAAPNINDIVTKAKEKLATREVVDRLEAEAQGPAVENAGAFLEDVLKNGLQEGRTVSRKTATELINKIFTAQQGEGFEEAALKGELIDFLKLEENTIKISAKSAKKRKAKPAAEATPEAPKAEEPKAGMFKSTKNLFVDKPGTASAVTAGVTALTLCLWPSKKEEITKDDGITETKKRSSGMKKTAVTVGALISAALLAYHVHGRVSGKWTDKIVGEKAASAAVNGIG